jgi:hypothetical protein
MDDSNSDVREIVPLAIDIVGLDKGDHGRSCCSHDACGFSVDVNDIIVLRDEVVEQDGVLEEVVKAFVVREGAPTCHVGFLPRRCLRAKDKYLNKYYTVVQDLRCSESVTDRRRSKEHYGIVKCLALNAELIMSTM